MIAILFLPFYIYVLNRSATLGKLKTIKQFIIEEVKNGEENKDK